MPYNVFTDFHHASLLQSFILLFEKRLGGRVFRPIGMEWATNGFWKVYDHPATQQQYLAIGGATPDGTPPLNEIVRELNKIDYPFPPGIWICQDIDSGTYNKAITYDSFMSMPFDIVIASLPQHIEPFARLCELHPNKPKLIYQIGNAWNVPVDVPVKNVMASAIVSIPENIHAITYHQEFDTSIFYPDFTHMEDNIISSFVNCFSVAEYMAQDWGLFQKVEQMLPNWRFVCLGGQCRDGAAHGSQDLAHKMRLSKFIWHTKEGGDGYGHVLFNSAAVGRPTIVKKSYYSGKLGDKLLIDGQTCINIDGLTPADIVDKINYYSGPNEYAAMCRKVYDNFVQLVDFDKEAERTKDFLTKLI